MMATSVCNVDRKKTQQLFLQHNLAKANVPWVTNSMLMGTQSNRARQKDCVRPGDGRAVADGRELA